MSDDSSSPVTRPELQITHDPACLHALPNPRAGDEVIPATSQGRGGEFGRSSSEVSRPETWLQWAVEAEQAAKAVAEAQAGLPSLQYLA